MSTADTFCMAEDQCGRICQLGPGHTSRHRFGAINLTNRQVETLWMIQEKANHEFFSPSGLAPLEKMGLIKRRLIGQRWWWAVLTPAGLAAANGTEHR